MKLIDYFYEYDYGHELLINIGVFESFNIFELYFGFSDSPGNVSFPSIGLTLFYNEIFSLFVDFWKVHFSIDFFSYGEERKNLNFYRKYSNGTNHETH
jgi:hypothetical protein